LAAPTGVKIFRVGIHGAGSCAIGPQCQDRLTPVPPRPRPRPRILLSCSQIRRTRPPAFRKARVTSRSRVLFADNFRCQNARLFFGWVACLGQPCPKQPSTKIAVRCFLKTKSGRTASDR
jgi:hypothetical protein